MLKPLDALPFWFRVPHRVSSAAAAGRSDRGGGSSFPGMANAMWLLVLFCAIKANPSTASQCGGISSARTRARAPLASSCRDHEEDPRYGRTGGAIFLNKWLHNRSTLTSKSMHTAVTTAKHKRTFAEPERSLPSGRKGTNVSHATETGIRGSDPRWWRRSVLWVRGGKKMTDQDQYDTEQQAVRDVLLYYPNLIGAPRHACAVQSAQQFRG